MRFTQRPQDIAADHAEALATVARRWHRGTLTGHAAVALVRTSEALRTSPCVHCGCAATAHRGPLGCTLCGCTARPLSADVAELATTTTLTPCQVCGAADTRNMLCVDGPRWGLPHVLAPLTAHLVAA